MKTTAYLIIDRNGNFRVNKNTAGFGVDELTIKLVLDIPDAFFTRPVPVANILIPKTALFDPGTECIVEVTAHTIARALQLQVDDVQDGLMRAVQKHEDAMAADAATSGAQTTTPDP